MLRKISGSKLGLTFRFFRQRKVLVTLLAVVIGVAMLYSWQVQHGLPYQENAVFHGPAEYGPALDFASSVPASIPNTQPIPLQGESVSMAATSGTSTTAQPTSAVLKPMVVETANINLVVNNVRKGQDRLEQMVAQTGGFVESSGQSGEGANFTVNMQLRVPVADFSSFVQAAKNLGTVTYSSQSGEDVTQQWSSETDQINELRLEYAAYSRLFAKAQSMKDMLTIEQALIQVQSQMDDLISQQHALSRSANLSTITITLAAPVFANTAPAPIVTAWQQIIASFGQSALSVFTMTAWLAPWALLFVILLLVIHFVARKKG